jgi:hypothetical protein
MRLTPFTPSLSQQCCGWKRLTFPARIVGDGEGVHFVHIHTHITAQVTSYFIIYFFVSLGG